MTWDQQIGARTLYGECRGEPEEGQRAVAHVLWNRLNDGRWGKNLASVCLSRMQFSCWNASDPQREIMAALSDDDVTLQKLATLLMACKVSPDDPTHGALYYFSDTMIMKPKWSIGMTFKGKIGHHNFFTDRQV